MWEFGIWHNMGSCILAYTTSTSTAALHWSVSQPTQCNRCFTVCGLYKSHVFLQMGIDRSVMILRGSLIL